MAVAVMGETPVMEEVGTVEKPLFGSRMLQWLPVVLIAAAVSLVRNSCSIDRTLRDRGCTPSLSRERPEYI
jgi:hypothetical protein